MQSRETFSGSPDVLMDCVIMPSPTQEQLVGLTTTPRPPLSPRPALGSAYRLQLLPLFNRLYQTCAMDQVHGGSTEPNAISVNMP